MGNEHFSYEGKKMVKQEFSSIGKKLIGRCIRKESMRKAQVNKTKGMTWTAVKQALFGMSVFQMTKGQQQQQGYFSL